ncbi:MAG: DNA alkylation repair protein [Deltaproteobacteria bacterium]|nr:DNA alkylation repair protein [Deltaproteobacteria bacterium]
MPEPFKETISRDFIKKLSAALKGASPGFDGRSFVRKACPEGFSELGLMDRVGRVAEALGAHLPSDYGSALKALFAVSEGFGGLPGFVFPRFVAEFGLTPERFDRSMDALKRFTVGSSSEFGVRPFIRKDPERALAHMRKWAGDANHEVRRLASEGARPRLPWGGFIPAFVKDPSPVLGIVEGLMEDPSLFVRKSLGNSLNDVSKDHPELFLEFSRKRLGKGELTDWILRRGARTLIKRKHGGALALFGYAAAPSSKADMLESASLGVSPATVKIGSWAELSYGVTLAKSFGGLVRLEYRVSYPPGPGKTPREKLFFLREKLMGEGSSLQGVRRVSFKDLSIRKQVPGKHTFELTVNGLSAAKASLALKR